MTSSDVKEILITEEQIQAKVRELAESINRDYRDKSPVLVGVLNGAFVFLADLMRHLDLSCTVDFVSWSSYGKDTSSSGVFRIMKDLETNVESRHVLIVEDIIDTGLTLHYLLDTVRARKPASVKVAASSTSPAAAASKPRPTTSASRFPMPSSSATASTSHSAIGTCPLSASSSPKSTPDAAPLPTKSNDLPVAPKSAACECTLPRECGIMPLVDPGSNPSRRAARHSV